MATFCPWRRVRASGESNRALTPRINPAAPANPAASPPPSAAAATPRVRFRGRRQRRAHTSRRVRERRSLAPNRDPTTRPPSPRASTAARQNRGRAQVRVEVRWPRTPPRYVRFGTRRWRRGRWLGGRRGAARRSNRPSQSASRRTRPSSSRKRLANFITSASAAAAPDARTRTTAPHRRSTACASNPRHDEREDTETSSSRAR